MVECVLLLGTSFAWANSSIAFTITDSRITKSSGLARDVANQRFWTVDHSGDSGVVYGLAQDGATIGTLHYRAHPRDVEAVAMQGARLYVADIGDNTRSRDHVTVYLFDHADPDDRNHLYEAYDLRYPDGPHDAETLLVSPEGRLYIVTKEASAHVYAAPVTPSRTGMNELRSVGAAPAYVTDGTYLPDGSIALRTYLAVLMLDPTSYAVTASAALPLQPQGESLTVSLDGDSLLVGSEGRRSTVLQVDVPTSQGNVPSGEPSPPGTASTSPSATPTATRGGSSDSGPAGHTRTGTWLALGLAGVVAVVAGLVSAYTRET